MLRSRSGPPHRCVVATFRLRVPRAVPRAGCCVLLLSHTIGLPQRGCVTQPKVAKLDEATLGATGNAAQP